MKLLIAGLAMGLLFAGAPAWADNERGHGWRGSHWNRQIRNWDNRWERHDRHFERHHQRRHSKHGNRRHFKRFDSHHHHPAPRLRHRNFHFRDHSYRHPALGTFVIPPNVYFSWSNR